MKKRVVPNSNQDKWLFYLLTSLNKMVEDSDWVPILLNLIEKHQQDFNAGKFRGAVFQMNYISKETLRMKSNLKKNTLGI